MARQTQTEQPWGAERIGRLYLATSPHLNMRDRMVPTDGLLLPSGIAAPETTMPIRKILGVGTLALAVELIDTNFIRHIPVQTLSLERGGGMVQITPLPELWFDSNGYGDVVGSLDTDAVDLVTQGSAAFVSSKALQTRQPVSSIQ